MSAPQLGIAGSRHFSAWLRERRASLAFATCKSGKRRIFEQHIRARHGLRRDTRSAYAVAVLPGARMPGAPGFKTEEIRRTITIKGVTRHTMTTRARKIG